MKKKTTKQKKKKMPAKTKATIKVTITRKILGRAPEKNVFYLHDGRKLRSIMELIDELETMSDQTFAEYANAVDNHFANWIEHVFDHKHLADELRHTNNRLDTQRAILKQLVRELASEHA